MGPRRRGVGGLVCTAAKEERDRPLEAVKLLLLYESQVQPLLVVFEDLHWIDSETQALLDRLVETLPMARMLLLVNYRPAYKHRWGSRTYYTQLRLDSLLPESAQELLQYLGSRGPEHGVWNPRILAPNLRLVLLKPRRGCTQDGQVCVDENLGIDADRCRGVACEHDEIMDPLCALGVGAQFSRGGTGPLGALLLVVVTPSVVDRIVEPETDTHLGRMFCERDDVLDLLEALRQVLFRMVVAMRLGISKQNVAIEAV